MKFLTKELSELQVSLAVLLKLAAVSILVVLALTWLGIVKQAAPLSEGGYQLYLTLSVALGVVGLILTPKSK